MPTKPKYAAVSSEDLIEIYCLFVRSCAEHSSVVFRSSQTLNILKKVENIQKTSLKIILRDNFVDYEAACEMAGLQKLCDRRQTRLLVFAKKCTKHPQNSCFFPRKSQLSFGATYKKQRKIPS